MRMSCIHCGKAFSITAEQLGGKGRCPHCRGEIRLPKATEESQQPSEEKIEPSHWLQNSMSGLLSLIFHMLLLLVLALITTGSSGVEGLGEDVLIGQLPSAQTRRITGRGVAGGRSGYRNPQRLRGIAGGGATGRCRRVTAAPPKSWSPPRHPPEGASPAGFELGAVAVGGGSMSGGSWDGMLQTMRRNGLDIVITFDSTGSMQGEIDQVKNQIQRIGSTLLTLVPKARIGICTYRDQGDEYVVRGLPLTSDIQEIESYLSGVRADAGGDKPESVHEGLRWSIQQNTFRPRARKVILLFGDAPPHQEDLPTCLRLASDFHGQQQGVVSTVTCRSPRKLQEFLEIADVGGGEAFVTADERQIMTQLIVLVFGSRHRAKVMEAFKLLDERR